MRIIAGKFKRAELVAPPDAKVTRPTTDRVKETLFQQLENRGALADATVLDLFAGSGALGLEAISRGALKAVFVDSHFGANRAIQLNIAKLGVLPYTDVRKTDANRFLDSTKYQFDLIFIDPPYHQLDDFAVEKLARKIVDKDLLKPGGILVVERAARTVIPTLLAGFMTVHDTRVVGETSITLATCS